nr:hypothetical protein [Tanacetum cinerariifolium]
MLLMALLNEHLMTFINYMDAKTLFAAIQTRFGGNESTEKTYKTLLKQMYENFSAPSTDSLESIFNRLQKIVSQLAILGENISQEDLNLKFLRSLPSEWNTYVVVWRNKHDLDTVSFDDLYNNFKIVVQEVKGTVNSSSSLSSQNITFVSSPSSTNEVNTAYIVSTTNTQVSHTSTHVSTASTQVSTANLSDATVYAFLANQPNRSQLKTGRKITINRSDTARYDKSKVECFNCHKLGHIAREYRQPRNQDSRNRNQDSSRRTANVEETTSITMVAIDGAGFDWSYMADDEVPTNMGLMAFSDSKILNDKTCSKTCLKSFETLKTQLDDLRIEFNKSEFNLATYKRGLASVEEQLVFYKKNKPEFEGYGPKTSNSVSEDISNEVKESYDALLVKELVSDDKLEKKTVSPTVAKREFVRPKKQEKPIRKPVKPRAVSTARPNSAVVNAIRENQINVVKASTCHASKETGYSKKYILLPLLKDGSLFDSSLKNANNDEPQPSSDAGKKNDDGVTKEGRINDQERPKNSTKDVNTVGPSINTVSTNVNTSSLNINTVSPSVTTAPLEATHADLFSDETEVDMSNISTTYLTSRMIKTTSKQGFISVVYEGKIHKDLYTWFEDPEFPDRVYKVQKALYGLHKALRACGGDGVAAVGMTMVELMDLRWRCGGDDVVVDRRWLVIEEGDDGSGDGWPEFGRSDAGYL